MVLFPENEKRTAHIPGKVPGLLKARNAMTVSQDIKLMPGHRHYTNVSFCMLNTSKALFDF